MNRSARAGGSPAYHQMRASARTLCRTFLTTPNGQLIPLCGCASRTSRRTPRPRARRPWTSRSSPRLPTRRRRQRSGGGVRARGGARGAQGRAAIADGRGDGVRGVAVRASVTDTFRNVPVLRDADPDGLLARLVRVVGDAVDRVEKESKQPKEQPLRLMGRLR